MDRFGVVGGVCGWLYLVNEGEEDEKRGGRREGGGGGEGRTRGSRIGEMGCWMWILYHYPQHSNSNNALSIVQVQETGEKMNMGNSSHSLVSTMHFFKKIPSLYLLLERMDGCPDLPSLTFAKILLRYAMDPLWLNSTRMQEVAQSPTA